MFQWTTNRQFVAPSAAAKVTVTPSSGAAWVNSGWFEVIASTDAAIVVTDITYGSIGTNSTEFEIDIGSGGAGSETVVGTVKGRRNTTTATQSVGIGTLKIPVPIDNIASSQRVAVRIRVNTSGSHTDWTIGVQYLKKPITGNLLVTAKPLLVVPSAADMTLLSMNASSWAYGSWTQIIASAAADLVLGAICIRPRISTSFEVQIGKGAASSEAPLTTIKGFVEGTGTTIPVWPCWLPLPNPLDNIASGQRVVARIRKDGTDTTQWAIGLAYYEKPL